MLTEERVEAIRQEVPLLKEKLETALGDLSEARQQSLINTIENPRHVTETARLDVRSINFDVANNASSTRTTRVKYARDVAHYLALRKLDSSSGLLRIHQYRLKQALLNEWKYCEAKTNLDYSESGSTNALF